MPQHWMDVRRFRVTGAFAAFAAFMAAIVAAPTATAADVTGSILAGNPSIVAVNGIKQLVPGGNIMGGADVGGGVFRTPNTVTVPSPQGFGILTDILSDHLVGGFDDPGYDRSTAIARDNALAQIQQDMANNPNGKIVYVCHSQGCDAGVQVISVLENSGVDTSNMVFVMAANPDRADGGIKTRLSFLPPIYVPLLGVTVGGQQPTTSDHTQVLEVTREYDGFADFPVYPLNLVADLNAIAGMVVLHSDYDKISLDDPNATFTHSANGMITDELIPTPVVPLLMVGEMLGLPAQLAWALDPAVRAVIDTGYNRLDYVPAQAVPFKLGPPPTAWEADLKSITEGVVESSKRLESLAHPGSTNTTPAGGTAQSARSPQSQDLSSVQGSSQLPPQSVAQSPAVHTSAPPVEPKKGPVLNSVRVGLRGSPGTQAGTPNGVHTVSLGASGGATNQNTVANVAHTVADAIHTALHPAKPGAGTASHDTGGSSSSD